MEEKQLELLFKNERGTTVRISIPSPEEPVDPVAVNDAMDVILQEDVFLTAGGVLTEKVGARLISRTVAEIVL